MQKESIAKCQRGAAAVEFAIVLPLLLIFIFGIIEFGILLYDKAIVTNASREGARTAILYHAPAGTSECMPATDVETVAENYCATHLINFSDATALSVTVSPITVGAAGMTYRTVTVSYGYSFLVFPTILATFFSAGTIPDPIPLNAATTMRMEDQGLTSCL
jgi:Flp pilus assembly protein TadG